jgi:YD repeat-containing protein
VSAIAFLVWILGTGYFSARVELLPFTDSPPAWNGSHPYSVVSMVDAGSDHVEFKRSIQDIAPTVRHDWPVNEFEVDLHSGMFLLRQTDLFIGDTMPLSLTRTYSVWDSDSSAFGVGANHPYDICPTGTRFPYTYMDLNLEDGRQINFPRISKGTGYSDAVYRHESTSSEFYDARINWNGNGWTLIFRDGRRYLFPESYHGTNFAQGAPIEMQDASGHRIQLMRDKERNLEKLISPSGRTITFKYDFANRVVEAADDAGNIRKYSYNSSGHLETVSDGSRLLYRFEYKSLIHSTGFDPYVMTSVADGKGVVLVENSYNNSGRISEQKLADGEVIRYDYLFDERFNLIETTVSSPAGKRGFFFQDGMVTKEE